MRLSSVNFYDIENCDNRNPKKYCLSKETPWKITFSRCWQQLVCGNQTGLPEAYKHFLINGLTFEPIIYMNRFSLLLSFVKYINDFENVQSRFSELHVSLGYSTIYEHIEAWRCSTEISNFFPLGSSPLTRDYTFRRVISGSTINSFQSRREMYWNIYFPSRSSKCSCEKKASVSVCPARFWNVRWTYCSTKQAFLDFLFTTLSCFYFLVFLSSASFLLFIFYYKVCVSWYFNLFCLLTLFLLSYWCISLFCIIILS